MVTIKDASVSYCSTFGKHTVKLKEKILCRVQYLNKRRPQ